MDKKFAFLNFWTEYESRGTLDKDMEREWCFGDVFYHDLNQNNTYTIIVYKDFVGINDPEAKNNACFMSKNELEEHLNYIGYIYPFTFSVNDKDDRFEIVLTLDAPRFVHRFVLTWLRYCYEFPFNMYIREAKRLSNTDGFKRLGLFNCFNLVGASTGYKFHGDEIHAIGQITMPHKFYSNKEVKDIVNKTDAKKKLNEIFCAIDTVFRHMIKWPGDNAGYKAIKDFSDKIKSYDYWNDDDTFKERLKYYKANKKSVNLYEKNKHLKDKQK